MLLFCGASYAVTFQKEFAGLYIQDEFDIANIVEFDNTVIALGLQYYVEPVTYVSGPYAKQDFLVRTPAVFGALGTTDFDIAISGLPITIDLDGELMMAGFDYRSKANPFMVSLLYMKNEADTNIGGTTLEVSMEETQLGVGYYIDPQSLLMLKVGKGEVELVGIEDDTDSYGFKFESLLDLGQQQYLNGSAELVVSEDSADNEQKEFVFELAYYTDPRLGFSVLLASNSGDNPDEEGETFGVGFSNFISDTTQIAFNYENFSGDGELESKSINLQFISRF